MTTIHYYIADPTKNITALVETPLPAASRPFAAARIMAREPACEQVGFVCRDGAGQPCLSMAGGEFCGNASMAAAALFCAEDGIKEGETRVLRLRVSGAAAPVPVTVTAQKDGPFGCTVRMPAPERIAEVSLPLDGGTISLPAVFFPGIAHIIAAEDELNAETAERVVRDWCGALTVAGLGVMLFDRARGTLRPLVYVPAADTLFWESSCASGTAALGALLATEADGDISLAAAEPGGTLRVRATKNGEIDLTGRVSVTGKREILIDIR